MEWVCIPSAGELDRLSIWRLRLLCTLALGQTCNSIFPSFHSVYFIPDIGCISLVSTRLCPSMFLGEFLRFPKLKFQTGASFLSCMIIYSRFTNVPKCHRNTWKDISTEKYFHKKVLTFTNVEAAPPSRHCCCMALPFLGHNLQSLISCGMVLCVWSTKEVIQVLFDFQGLQIHTFL